MVVEPRVRGFICTTAHAEGCKKNVKRQIEYVKKQGAVDGAKKVLVIGASTGYGLATRVSLAFGCNAATVGVIFDKPASGGRTASAGWYNTAALEEFAAKDGLYAKTINGDAFSQDIKRQTIELIKRDLGEVDLVVYSLASPRRTMPDGTTYTSVLKTTGDEYRNKTIDLKTGAVSQVSVPCASQEEVQATVKVMGGGDWQDWIDELGKAGALAKGAVTVAYSYIGPELTHPMYLEGSIGKAKEHLLATANTLTAQGVQAYVSVNKALVTQSSAAIPIVPLYISILYKVMKAKGVHEGCTRQMCRMCHDRLYAGGSVPVDSAGRIRMDDLEMREDIQREVSGLWDDICDDNVAQVADIEGYWDDFYQMFGFRLEGVDYSADIQTDVKILSIEE